jgi:catechol 2,3-dioxygenase-like lactoylglutathione lyase family enzyme
MAMLVCSNLERSRDFYRVVLGLKLRTNDVPHWVDFELPGGCVLGLHPAGAALAVRPGSLQLAFYVANVDKFVTDARASGVRILQEPYDERQARIAVIADPDGYPVQIGSSRGE